MDKQMDTTLIISMIITLILTVAILPSVLSGWIDTSTIGWNAGSIAMWGVFPIVVIAGLLVTFSKVIKS